MTDNIAIIASQPLADPSTTQTSPEDKMTAKETLEAMKKTWKSSLLLKIVSGVVLLMAILVIVFLSTTVSFSSSKSECDNNLKNEKSKSTKCEDDKKGLNNQISDLRQKLDDEKKISNRMQGEIKVLQDKQKELESTIKDKDQQINSLTSKNDELTHRVDSLDAEVRRLQNDVHNKNNEIDQLKKEVQSRDVQIQHYNQTMKYYQWGALGSGAVHVGTIIDEISTHSALSTSKQKVAVLETENTNLKGHVNNLSNKVKELEAESDRLKQEIIHVNDLRQQCQQDLAHERELYEDCKRQEVKLHSQIAIIPGLALEQAKLQLLLSATKKTIVTSLMYNSTEHGFNKGEFINRIGARKPTVVIVKTTSGYVFGGSISIAWASSGGLQTDEGAFTFSTTNNHVCKVKSPNRAVYFNDDYFMEFGDPEFWIEKTDSKRARGNAESDHVFGCDAKDKQNFYADGVELTVQELAVHHVEIRDA